MTTSRLFTGLLLTAAAVLAACWWLQRQAAAELRTELALAHDTGREMAQMRLANARLAAATPAPAEFERLRSDHAAVERMRNEIATLRAEIERRERALTAGK